MTHPPTTTVDGKEREDAMPAKYPHTVNTDRGPVTFRQIGEPIAAVTTRRYFVTDCWIGVGGHLHRYEVTGPDGHVGIFKTLGEAVACADSLDAADTR